MATFRGSEYFCYDLSQNPIQSSSDEITLSFKTWQRNGLILHTGKSADYVNLALKDGAVSLVINLGSGAFEAIVEPVNGKFNDNSWHDVKVTRNLRQVQQTLALIDQRAPLEQIGEEINQKVILTKRSKFIDARDELKSEDPRLPLVTARFNHPVN